jgi:hypothetical protein
VQLISVIAVISLFGHHVKGEQNEIAAPHL